MPLPGVQPPVPIVSFDLPEGDWSLNVLIISYQGGEKQTEGYLNPILPQAADILLQTVYQPVYDHFEDEFGKTFMGFFSDEPRFGNIHGAETASIGRNSAMDLPWRDDMPALLASHCKKLGGVLGCLNGDSLLPLLPLLFIGDGEQAHALRYAYMDLISQLYSEHFDGRIAAWCHKHGCQHIGHAIEDNAAASRLGYGAGHLFRAMAHADMAGIDVVIHQLIPGMDKGLFKGRHAPGWDGEFFTYLLGKFGGSLAHFDPKKQGRCMCELFGAYGWAEGNRMAKWLTDYMLVRGVNVFVPHAFNCAPFPDPDCPPHFCRENPQMPEFRLLMDYCNRLCNLLSGGAACPDVALYFNAEGEWSGAYMPTQKPAAALARNQIDYDLISADFLAQADAKDGKLQVNATVMKGLILPWAEALPGSLLTNVLRLAQKDVPVWFVNALPDRCAEGGDGAVLTALEAHPRVHIVPLDKLPAALYAAGIPELKLSSPQPMLRHYHYRQKDGDLYFFVNESATARVETKITGTVPGSGYVYDPFNNTVTEEKDAFVLDLPPYGSKLVAVPDEPITSAWPAPAPLEPISCLRLESCTVTLIDALGGKKREAFHLDHPCYISGLPGWESFSGRIMFHFAVELDTAPDAARLTLCGVREGASVYVNGKKCGTKICPDYIFALENIRAGANEIVVELNTTLARSMNDPLSSFLPMEPTGMTGAVLELAR